MMNTVSFQSCYIFLSCHSQKMLLCPSLPTLGIFRLLNFCNVECVKWNFNVALIYIFLKTNEFCDSFYMSSCHWFHLLGDAFYFRPIFFFFRLLIFVLILRNPLHLLLYFVIYVTKLSACFTLSGPQF